MACHAALLCAHETHSLNCLFLHGIARFNFPVLSCNITTHTKRYSHLYKGCSLLSVKRPLVLEPPSVASNALDLLAVKVGHCKILLESDGYIKTRGSIPGLPALELLGSTLFFLTRAKNSLSFSIIWDLYRLFMR